MSHAWQGVLIESDLLYEGDGKTETKRAQKWKLLLTKLYEESGLKNPNTLENIKIHI